ncbi:hypothetical protein PENSPDRAFT_418497 [Peniophora sp. CONT]|nr:hypothetical protein PENSPDRAFT_418497 [Peniophora sp. CONT]
MAIPILSALMYTISLVHWAISIWNYTSYLNTALLYAANIFTHGSAAGDAIFTELLSALLSLNIVLSDSIVIWRMCVVWDKARPALVTGTALLVTVLGLNITNWLILYHILGGGLYLGSIYYNGRDIESMPTFGFNSLGLATVFMSLASNLCATILVGLRAWYGLLGFSS